MEGFTNVSRSLLRKFRKMEFRETKPLDEYDDQEMQYRKMKSSAQKLSDFIKRLKYYEHGNSFFKDLKSGLQYLNDTTGLGMYEKKDLFQEMSELGNILKSSKSKSMSKLGGKTANVYESISKSKVCLNSKLESIKLKLKEMKSELSLIDRERKRAYNARIDLEYLLKDPGYNDELKETMTSKYEKQASTALEKMKEFCESGDIEDTIREVSKEYMKHLEESAGYLKFLCKE